jgi:hypothetical protein
VTETVNKVSTSTALLAGPSPAVFGQTITVTATVTGPLPLTGTLQFLDGANVIGTQTPGSGGSASFSTTSLVPATHTLSAVYSGDASHTGSTAAPVQVIVNLAPTTTSLTVGPNPSKLGQAVAMIATVTGAQATGSVTFTDGPTTIGSAALAGGSATLNISNLTSGTHSIIATYSGNTDYATSSSGFVNLTVGQAPVTLISSQNPSAVGQSVTFTATVTGNSPTGTVSFLDGGSSLMDVPLSGGVAAYTTSTLPSGNQQITARYNGDANNASAFSATMTQIVGVVVPATGYWFNPAEQGRGYVIEQQGNNLFMAAFLYDASGRATWYSVGPGAIAASTYSGTLVSYGGGQSLTGAYQTPSITNPSAGAVTVSFSSQTQGTLAWPEGTIPIQRFDFGPGGSGATQPAGTPQTGFWYAPTEPGSGYSIEIQGNLLFLAGYMYDPQGNPIWYSSGPLALSNDIYQGTWQQYGNGQTLTGSYQVPTIVNTDVGNVTIQFSTTTAGILTFPNGSQVAIQRFTFQ